MRPRSCESLPLLKPEGAGNAGSTMHPQPRVQMKKAHEHSHHGHTGNHPAFPAQWFYGLLRALPGDHACLTPSPALLLADLTPTIGASEPHDFAVRFSAIRQRRRRVHRIPRSTSVTIAKRPLRGGGTANEYDSFGSGCKAN